MKKQLMIAIATACLLSACGDSKPQNEQTQATPQTQPATAPKKNALQEIQQSKIPGQDATFGEITAKLKMCVPETRKWTVIHEPTEDDPTDLVQFDCDLTAEAFAPFNDKQKERLASQSQRKNDGVQKNLDYINDQTAQARKMFLKGYQDFRTRCSDCPELSEEDADRAASAYYHDNNADDPIVQLLKSKNFFVQGDFYRLGDMLNQQKQMQQQLASTQDNTVLNKNFISKARYELNIIRFNNLEEGNPDKYSDRHLLFYTIDGQEQHIAGNDDFNENFNPINELISLKFGWYNPWE